MRMSRALKQGRLGRLPILVVGNTSQGAEASEQNRIAVSAVRSRERRIPEASTSARARAAE